jgi:hypothetical protein
MKRVFLISFAFLFLVIVMPLPSKGQDAATPRPPAPAATPQPLAPYGVVDAGVFFHRPGDMYGTRYGKLQDCERAREKAGAGVCMMKWNVK